MKERLFEIVFQFSGMWFYVGGKEKNNTPTEITYVSVLEESKNRYVKVHYDANLFKNNLALKIQDELKWRKTGHFVCNKDTQSISTNFL